MKNTNKIKRRDFLRTASAAGFLGLVGCESPTRGKEGDQASASASGPTEAQLLPQLRTIAKEFVTIFEEEGRFLNLVLKLTRARQVLEIGTAHGYTTIWLAQALGETGGHLTTLELLPERFELAKKHVSQAGLSHRVSFEQGDAHTLVTKLTEPFDLVYLDADKGGNADYFQKLFPKKLTPGGLLIAHNAILLADKMKSYLDLVSQHADFETVIARAVADDGLALSYRKRKAP